MTRRLSANGKPLGRPPGTPQATLAAPTPDDRALAVGKAVLAVKARYDAAGRGRKMASWNAPSSGPNTSMQGLQTIRNRSHDAARNDWAGESGVQKWTTSLIGIGIRPRFNRFKDKARKQFVTDLHADVMRHIDADGVVDGYGQQTLAVRTWLLGGEAFGRKRARFSDEGLPLPFQVQLLEAEMCPMLDHDQYQGMPEGNIMRSGIELNKRGRRVAYWFYKQHPGDKPEAVIGPDVLIRVAASEVIHMFEQKRPGQLRGVSMLAPILARLRSIGDYEDTTLERQKIANLWVGFISRTLPTMDSNDIDNGALTGLGQETDGDPGPGLLPLKAGLIQELEDGQTFNFANPPEAGTTYSDYMRTSHLGTAAAAGMPYELYSGDILNISDRTLRVLINEFRRFAEQRQWQIVIPMWCQTIIDWFAESAVLAGVLSLEEGDMARRVEHAPHGWAYIHPTQDVQGKVLEITNGLRSRSSVIGERGDDPDSVDDERAADQKRAEALGLPDTTVPAPVGGGGAPADPSAPEKPPKTETQPTPQQRSADLAELRRTEAHTDLLRVQAQTPPVAPVHNVTVHLAPTTVENTTNVPKQDAPAVNVAVHVPAQAPAAIHNNIHLPEQAAPVVHMETTVMPAEVQVHLPTRKTDTTVQYDSKGNISATTQIESDVE
jgi:lambda family phage portal protein